MTLAELIAEVVTITKRADLQTTTIPAAVKASTLKLHQQDFYAKDLYEIAIAFPTADYYQTFQYANSIPNWRALKYLRKLDPTTGLALYGDAGKITIITPEQIVDNYGVEKTNVAYEAGQILIIKMDTQTQYMALGCYVNPTVTDAGYSSWIANLHPYAIVYEAAGTVFKQIGQDQMSADMRVLVADQMRAIQVTNVQTVGY